MTSPKYPLCTRKRGPERGRRFLPPPRFEGSVCILTESKKHGKILIDKKDYDLVKDYRWQAHKCRRRVYARAKNKNGEVVTLHRIITDFSPFFIDHVNGNGLDNRRENLRITTHVGNMLGFRRDQSKIKACYKTKDGYVVKMRFRKKDYYLATVKDERAARRLWDRVRALLADAVEHNVMEEMKNNKTRMSNAR